MSSNLTRIALTVVALAGWTLAQEPTPTPADDTAGNESTAAQPIEKAEAEPTDDVTALREKEKVRVLKPEEVAGELLRLNTKADIKAEISIKTYSGRPVVFKGVIRNGKLIERIVERRFVAQNDVAHPRCGVRLWWSGDNDGYIFFRYTNIKSVAITGKLTEEERAEIMRRLRAKEAGEDPDAAAKKAAAAADTKETEFDKLTPEQREAVLMARFPAEKGWTSHRYRDLKKKQVVDNVKLSSEEALFVKYFRVLEQARYRNVKIAATKKEEFEPGSADAKPEVKPEPVEPPAEKEAE
jgi:hypothetical protein